MLIAEIRKAITESRARSTWDYGVREYALEIFNEYVDGQHLSDTDSINGLTEKGLLRGARDWQQYSYGACSLVYSGDINERLFDPSKNGRDSAYLLGVHKDWLGVQAKALEQASHIVLRLANRRD